VAFACADGSGNYPLHYTMQGADTCAGIGSKLLRLIFTAAPHAALQPNHDGKRPIDLVLAQAVRQKKAAMLKTASERGDSALPSHFEAFVEAHKSMYAEARAAQAANKAAVAAAKQLEERERAANAMAQQLLAEETAVQSSASLARPSAKSVKKKKKGSSRSAASDDVPSPRAAEEREEVEATEVMEAAAVQAQAQPHSQPQHAMAAAEDATRQQAEAEAVAETEMLQQDEVGAAIMEEAVSAAVELVVPTPQGAAQGQAAQTQPVASSPNGASAAMSAMVADASRPATAQRRGGRGGRGVGDSTRRAQAPVMWNASSPPSTAADGHEVGGPAPNAAQLPPAAAFAASQSTTMPSAAGRPDLDEVSTSSVDASCVVCMESPKTHAFVPCGHICACGDCGARVMSSMASCPYCREPAIMAMRLYAT
jgi:hypothetical protein